MKTRSPLAVPTLTFALGLAGIGVAGSGCDTGARPAAGVGQDPVAYPNITTDGALQKFLKVDYTMIVFTPPAADRPLFVQVPVRNQADNEVALQYNFTFFAADGRQVGESGYRLAVLNGRRQEMLSANAITREATAWRLDIRSAR